MERSEESVLGISEQPESHRVVEPWVRQIVYLAERGKLVNSDSTSQENMYTNRTPGASFTSAELRNMDV